MKLVRAFFLGAILLHAFNIAYSADVGNGDVPLEDYFKNAKKRLPGHLGKIKSCSFDNVDVEEKVANWLTDAKNRAALAEDVADSKHVWVNDFKSGCALTRPVRKAEIILSYDGCRNEVHSDEDAMDKLAHESTHHLGYIDEDFAKAVGKAVVLADLECVSLPVEDVFDSSACEGLPMSELERLKYFRPATNMSETVAVPEHFERRRSCHSVTGCDEWEYFDEKSATNFKWINDFDHRLFDPSAYGYASSRTEIGNLVTVNSPALRFRIESSSKTTRLHLSNFLERWPYNTSNPERVFENEKEGSFKMTFRVSWSDINQSFLVLPLFSYTLTNECFRAEMRAKTAETNNGFYEERHYVYYGKVNAPLNK